MRPPTPGAGWTVLVTGASSGLGRCLALELARLGCSLVLSGRDTLRLAAVEAEARAQGSPWATSLVADLAASEGVRVLIAAVEGLGRPVDALVNNAGAGRAGPWCDLDAAEEAALLQLLMHSPLALTRALRPGWRTRGWGAVLNVASTGAFQPGPQTAVYYAAKAFVLSWSLALAQEEGRWLAVTTLCPGALKTGFARAAGKIDVVGAPGPERAARAAVRAWSAGRRLVVPGMMNKLLVGASRLLPPTWVAGVVEGLQLAVKKR